MHMGPVVGRTEGLMLGAEDGSPAVEGLEVGWKLGDVVGSEVGSVVDIIVGLEVGVNV